MRLLGDSCFEFARNVQLHAAAMIAATLQRCARPRGCDALQSLVVRLAQLWFV